jgi:hypothetical protein
MPAIDYPGIDGFLGTRASASVDLLFLTMFAIVPVLAWSIYIVKYRQQYQLHKRVQLGLGIALLIAVVFFELDIRLYGWTDRAAGQIGGSPSPRVWFALYIHLLFAVTATFLWPIVIVQALRKFPSPPLPGVHSRSHIFWAWLTAIITTVTACTGCTFYWLAFAR